jgi:O-succinylbenzoic acid--CoA ligase
MVLVGPGFEAAGEAFRGEGHRCVDLAAVARARGVGGGGAGPEAAALAEAIDDGAVHTILFTSGTAGPPKAAALSFANHAASARAAAVPLGVTAADRWLACLPLHHVGGLAILFRGAVLGFTVVLHARFVAEDVWAALEQERITIVSLVPEMLSRLLEARPGETAPPALRTVLLGGGGAASALLEHAARRGFRVSATYGLTEAASQVTTVPWDAAARDRGTAGPPVPGAAVRIARADGGDAAAFEEGEILVRGPMVMLGYVRDPEATGVALEGGWLHTGDVGCLDGAGHLIVLARRTDLIVSGGENVYPAEVESALLSHPDVADAAVAALPDPRWGSVPAALVVLRAGARMGADELSAHVGARLAAFKTPRRIVFADSIPRTASGKTDRARTQAILAGLPLPGESSDRSF